MYQKLMAVVFCCLLAIHSAHAEETYACLEENATGFKGEEMVQVNFNGVSRFSLKHDEVANTLHAEKLMIVRSLLGHCAVRGNYISCLNSRGTNLLYFNPDTGAYRWAFLGFSGDSTFIAHGFCERF